MKKIVLLGDSIRQIGYGTVLPDILKDTYEIWQPEENCRFSSYTLRMLFDYQENIKDADIIHWNNGHWDLCNLFGDGSFTSVEVYVDNLKRIAKLLKNITDTVIFATTTPVNPTHKYNSNEDILKYNKAAVSALEDMGIIINDLYSVVLPNIDTFITKEDNIHLTKAGIDACAQHIADFIKSVDK